ncbi:ABC transporter permease [Methylophaga pinxianii]|uniref:ABC transporter permease n=1 Tax=Methylophaga pinxianii TaxID=2881052 RepID=UPI001CF2746E|nr:ABC transporter permease [Methylophaga pinxianii]MCB2426691.1 ABC transporter permease [Methylophaga pinxianii]UPH44498.1 ABC transporter permease [Methylophaga pinxianii]
MPFLPVFLWTDILIFLLLAVITAGILYLHNKPHLRAPWIMVMQRKRGVISVIILLSYVFIGVLDSLHFRLALAPQQDKQQHYSTEVLSVLDWLVTPIRTQVEKTYSAPFATRLFVKEMQVGQSGQLEYSYPRLRYSGQHLQSENEKWADVTKIIVNSTLQATLFTLLLISFYLLYKSFRYQRKPMAEIKRLLKGESEFPVRTFYLMVFLLSWLCLTLIMLSQHYHVMGTDKVGQSVLYQALKSIRTGLAIGTLTTLVMLPLAILLGISAGYFRGWIDDVIQYIYTTLNSIPGVLLIAAAVLMLQVYMNTHPENFATIAERADIRLLFLCLILGVTSWTGLCRILRGETLKLREAEYVLAARSLGVGSFKILHRHILPNLMHIVLITVVLDFSGLVLAEAVLSYVGVGVDPSMISWGNMINSARLEMAREPVVWWSLTAAFISMFILVLAANLFADVVRDAFDPRMQKAR